MIDPPRSVLRADVHVRSALLELNRAMRHLEEAAALVARARDVHVQEYAGTIQTAIDALRRANAAVDATTPVTRPSVNLSSPEEIP